MVQEPQSPSSMGSLHVIGINGRKGLVVSSGGAQVIDRLH
jgi:hypothetical protein